MLNNLLSGFGIALAAFYAYVLLTQTLFNTTFDMVR